LPCLLLLACRKRIKAIRQALEKKGWATTGY
jgi:hypothetical protein